MPNHPPLSPAQSRKHSDRFETSFSLSPTRRNGREHEDSRRQPGGTPESHQHDNMDERTVTYVNRESLERLDNAAIIDQTLDDE